MYIDESGNLVPDDYHMPSFWQRNQTEQEATEIRTFRAARDREEMRRYIARKQYVVGIGGFQPSVGDEFLYSGLNCRVLEVLSHELVAGMDPEDADAFSADPRLTETHVSWQVRIELLDAAGSADRALLASYPRRESYKMTQAEVDALPF